VDPLLRGKPACCSQKRGTCWGRPGLGAPDRGGLICGSAPGQAAYYFQRFMWGIFNATTGTVDPLPGQRNVVPLLRYLSPALMFLPRLRANPCEQP
jgi:hypothetical protein